MFKLDNLSEEDAIDLLESLLAAGVPPAAISLALHIETEFIKGLASEVRIRRYGTAEIAEAMAWLMWEAYEKALDMIRHGSPAQQIRAVAMVLPRSVGMAARQDPEEFSRLRGMLEEMIEGQTTVLVDEQPGEFNI